MDDGAAVGAGATGVVVRCDHVVKRYAGGRKRAARDVLRGVSLAVDAGERVALLGANGSGKSTLIRMLCGLERLTAGGVEVYGEPVRGRLARGVASRVGVVFQSASLDPLLTVRENLRLAAALAGGENADVEEAAGSLGIADRLDDRVDRLSGGLARRCDLARAMLHDPALLLLDEATSGLDHASREVFWSRIEAWQAQGDGRTLVYSTHTPGEADRARRVVMISGGEIVADGRPSELRERAGERVLAGDADGVVLGTGDDEELAERARELVRDGVAFRFAPPGLGEAYAVICGRSLDDDADIAREVAEGAS